MKINIDQEKCKGCRLCINFCTKDCIKISEKVNQRGYFYAVYSGGCIGCRSCALMCPEAIIEIIK